MRNKSKHNTKDKSVDSMHKSQPSTYSSPDKSYRTYQKGGPSK
jgi:hypothetical protein